MNNTNNLFRIGEISKIMGITRKTILVFEDAGLLTPAYKDEESGYRYYSADNMTQIRSIRSLQELGLSLKEIKEYYYDIDNIDSKLERLLEIRENLDRNIHLLRVRSVKQGDLSVHHTTLSHQYCFCRRYKYIDVATAAINLRETYIAAASTGYMHKLNRMFTLRDGDEILCCIPMEKSYKGSEIMELAPTPALCVYYRGSYEGIGAAIISLKEYIKKNYLEVAGPFRSIYLEGPPNRGNDSDNYITQIAVPIKEAGALI